MRASMAYFAGAGTVLAAIVAGVGGGLLVADMISPKSPKQGTELTRLERRMSPQPIQAAASPSEPVPYLATPQPSAPGTAVAAASVQAQADAPNPAPVRAQPVETSAATQPADPATQPVANEQATTSGARDADVKRVVEKRKAERRQQWTERRRERQQQELRAVEERVRDETEPRRVFAAEPVRIETPQIRLFGPD